MRKIPTILITILLCLTKTFLSCHDASAQANDYGLPSELAPWIDWVSKGNPEWDCAKSGGTYKCVWPGSISYTVSNKGAKFLIQAVILSESTLRIPSSAQLNPFKLEFKDKSNLQIFPPLEISNGSLFAKLKPGEYSVSGEFAWDVVPAELPLPESYGIIEVKFEGLDTEKLAYSRLAGSVRFSDREKTDKTSSVNLKVFRKLLDTSPLIIESLLRVQVSGGARSYQVGNFLPRGAKLTDVSSALPYQIGADGNLTLQLLPGSYDLYFTSVLPQPVNAVELPEFNPDIWPKEETWSWNANTILRSVEIDGAQAVESSLTELPDEWKNAATYLVSNNAKVELKEIRRGKERNPYSALNLQRSLWIDLDGSGYTVSDNFSGELQEVSRLNALKETQLGRASLNGNQQLITHDPQNNLTGVEVRDINISLNTVSRIDNTKTISAVGWDTKVDTLNLNLNLPPSWMLLATLNTSYASDSWFESWSLFEVFILILIIIASYKIFGLNLAVLIGLAGIINYREFLAPNLLIIHIILLEVCRRLVRDKESFFYKLFHWLLISTFALWALASITFTKLQFTQLLFPLLQSGTRYRTMLQELLLALENSLFSWPLLLLILAVFIYGLHLFITAKSIWKRIFYVLGFGFAILILVPFFFSTFRFYEYSGSKNRAMMPQASSYLNEMRSFQSDSMELLSKSPAPVAQQDQSSRIFQSGPATPEWKWRSHAISVSGPVDSSHNISFLLLSPKVTRALCGLRCLVALLTIMFLFRALAFRINVKPVLTTAVFLLFSFSFMHTQNAYADIPDPELLKEIEKRMSEKQCSSDTCAVVREMKIVLSGSSLTVYFEVTSEGHSSITVPGPVTDFNVKTVILNGKESLAVRNANSFLEIKTVPGNNRLEIRGEVPDSTSFALELPEKALFTSVDAPGWYVEGISENGQVVRGLHFTKEEQGSSKKTELTENKATFNSWVIASRSLVIGESISVTTNLRRLGDISAALRVELPLLNGENVTNKDTAREGDKLIVFIPANQSEFEVNSNIALTDTFKLISRPAQSISEEWKVFCETFVSCSFDGLKPTAANLDARQKYLWHPFPGEEVDIAIKSLKLADGEYLTVDKVFHNVNWGANRRSGNIQINLRATKQQSFNLKLDAAEQIENVTVDSVQGTSKVSGSEVSMLLSPGSHTVDVKYARQWQADYRENSPVFHANSNLHNIALTINPSNERWIVWTGGGFWGPSVVFWAKIIVLFFLVHLMVRFGFLDLSVISTVLLALGLSTLPVILICIPLLWLAVLKFIPVLNDKILPEWRISKSVLFWVLSLITLVIFYNLVRSGLVLEPPMLIVGNNSNYYSLKWFYDHSGNQSPSSLVISFPVWYWRTIALIWSGWFVFKLFEWLKQMVEAGKIIQTPTHKDV